MASGREYIIYIDESGDLGFGAGGSSYLVIAAVCVPREADVDLKRYVRRHKRKLGLTGQQEMKSIHSNPEHRREFCAGLACLKCEIRYVVINKKNVSKHLRADTNILYNYAAQLLLSRFVARLSRADLFLDVRTVRVASGNSFPDYLRIKLWYEMGSRVELSVTYTNSAHSLGVQAADFVAGAVFRHYARGEHDGFRALRSRIAESKRLFF